MKNLTISQQAAMTLPAAALAQSAEPTMTVRTTGVISTKDAHVGDPLTFAVDGQPDATAYGSVIDVDKRGSRAQSGSITVQVRYIRAGDQRINVNGIFAKEAKSSTGAKIAAAGIGGLFIKGKHAVIDAGTPITVTVEQ